MFPLLSKKIDASRSSATIASLIVASMAVLTVSATTKTKNQPGQKKEKKENSDERISFQIESNLMDHIQQKQYLSNAKDLIPSTFRVLSIDLPEIRSKFNGECRLSHDKIFLDEVAPPKVIKDRRKAGPTKIKIPQKVLVQSIVHCSSPQSHQHVGVELLEASISNLNRYKLRKKQSFGNYTYDPLKYNNGDDDDDDDHDANDESESTVNTEISDEIEAPWNQYAWMEELKLRMKGNVHYGEALEKSTTYERLLFGNHYKSTVPAVYKVWDFFVPFSFAKSDPNGIDGRNHKNVRACHKPHAVIVNGAALQLVPTSLRLLQRLCKKEQIPLFIVLDSRRWGANTQGSLEEALLAMRTTVKNKVIENALIYQGSSAFTRGRIVGQIETEAKWQLKDKAKRAKEMLKLDSRDRKIEKEDWSLYDKDTLESKLVQMKVIRFDEDNVHNVSKNRSYSPEFIEIVRECTRNERKVTTTSSNTGSTEAAEAA